MESKKSASPKRHLQSAMEAKRQKELDEALIEASILADMPALREALRKGANPNAVDEGGFTALMWAARYGLREPLAALLPVSDFWAKDLKGRDALALAEPGGACHGALSAFKLSMDEASQLIEAAHEAPKRSQGKFRL